MHVTFEGFEGAVIRRLTRREFGRLVEAGAFEGEKVELLAGFLVEKMTQGPRHAEVLMRVGELLMRRLEGRARVRIQVPLALSEDSEPEPDVFVVPLGSYLEGHPSRAYWVIEVSSSSIRLDRGLKARLYATAGVPEYWIVDVDGGVVEVHTEPANGAYARTARHALGEAVRSTSFPDVEIRVEELLR